MVPKPNKPQADADSWTPVLKTASPDAAGWTAEGQENRDVWGADTAKIGAQPPWYTLPGIKSRLYHYADIGTEALPAAGATVGAVGGSELGPLGSIVGATLGGGGGEAARQLSRRALGFESPQTSEEAAKNINREMLTQGAIEAGTLGVARGAKALAPRTAETALGIRPVERMHGKTPGIAVIQETKGMTPAKVTKSASDQMKNLAGELETRTNAATAAMTNQPRSIKGLLPGARTEVPLPPTPTAGKMPGALQPAATRLEGATSPFTESEQVGAQAVSEPGLHDPQFLTSARPSTPEVPFPPELKGGGILSTRGPIEAPRTARDLPSVGKYPRVLSQDAPSLKPARDFLDNEMTLAAAGNDVERYKQLEILKNRITRNELLNKDIPEKVSPREILDLKRGLRSQIKSWKKVGVSPVEGGGEKLYGLLDAELDRTVPGAAEINQRLSSLRAVKDAAKRKSLGAAAGQKISQGLASYGSKALLGGITGGLAGEYEGGHTGAAIGAAAGLAAPVLVTDPAFQMFLVRSMQNAPKLQKYLTPGLRYAGSRLGQPAAFNPIEAMAAEANQEK